MISAFYAWLLPLPLAGLTLTDWWADHRTRLSWEARSLPSHAAAQTLAVFDALRVLRAR